MGTSPYVLKQNLYLLSNNLDVNTTVSYTDTTFRILVSEKDNSGAGSCEFVIDGTSQGTGTGNQNLGNRYWLGCWNNNRMNGDIAEAMIYNAPLTVADRQVVEGLLAWKYGLQGQLPANHPWKSVDPSANGTPPVVVNSDPTNITATSATVVGYLVSTGGAPTTVSVYWGSAEGGSPDSGLWQHTNTFAEGQWAENSYPSTNLSQLASNTFYYYRFAAANVASSTWAGASSSFLAGDIWVTAPVPNIAESNATKGILTIQRGAAATNLDSIVAIAVSGTASNGSDYLLSPRTVTTLTLPAGVSSSNITVVPLADRLAEPAESVVVRVLPSKYYSVGNPASNTVTIAASAAVTSPTLGYWRFEGNFNTNDPTDGFCNDSSGSGHYIMWNGGSISPASQVTIPHLDLSINRGAAFPNPVPQLQATNAKCFWSQSAGWVEVADSDDWTPAAFTVEAFISPKETATNNNFSIVSHYNANAVNERSWFFGKQFTRLGVILSADGTNNTSFNGPDASWDLNTSNDFYAAFSFDKGQTNEGVTLYLKNLSLSGPLKSASFNHSLTNGLHKAASSVIICGASGSGNSGVLGMFDEVRISCGVLETPHRLINRVVRGSVMTVR